MSKVLEKVVLSQILQHINCNKLLSDFQSACSSHHSTETALLKVTNDLLSAMNDGKISVLGLLDLSTAFDTIDHESVLHHLHNVFGNWRHCAILVSIIFRESNTNCCYTWKTLDSSSSSLQCTTGISSWTNTFYSLQTASIKCHKKISSFSLNVCR